MKHLTLVVMAAGMGSRFGGLKQITPVDQDGNFLIDYSVYDAIRAGFERVVFIIKKENLEDFKQTIGKRLEDKIEVCYSFQEMKNVPSFVKIPEDRVKPWGTVHAILSAKDAILDSFAVINADDFYGSDSYKIIADYLKTSDSSNEHISIPYPFCNVSSPYGFVKRGVLFFEQNKVQKILLRITPGIECHTHKYIQTGHLDSKFGFDLTQIDDVINLIKNECSNLEIKGLHAHIGSQIFETRVYYDEIGVLIKELKRINTSHNLNLNEINAGGGLGITYVDSDCPPSIDTIANVIITSIKDHCEKFEIEEPVLYIEPGRSIVGTAGVTLYTIGSFKQVPNGRKYIAVDGGMADNPRPSMYEAKYYAEIANFKNTKDIEKVTVAGRFCESGDILIKDIDLNSPETGDILCVYNTGAYGYSMSSNYNRVLKPAMILVNNSQSDIIIKRETYEQLVQNDVLN